MATDRSMSEIRHELADRLLKRDASDPQYQETLLNDTNPRGLVQYSGTDSKVCVSVCTLYTGTKTTVQLQ